MSYAFLPIGLVRVCLYALLTWVFALRSLSLLTHVPPLPPMNWFTPAGLFSSVIKPDE
jgi:hypothetical protein